MKPRRTQTGGELIVWNPTRPPRTYTGLVALGLSGWLEGLGEVPLEKAWPADPLATTRPFVEGEP
jgi:hypothetical protein